MAGDLKQLLELAKELGYAIEMVESAKIDKRIRLGREPLLAQVDEEHVAFDTEPVTPGDYVRFFVSTCHDNEGKVKRYDHGASKGHTNMIGWSGSFPSGFRKTVKALSLTVMEGVVDEPVEVRWFVAGAPCGESFKLAPNEITPVNLKVKLWRPKLAKRDPNGVVEVPVFPVEITASESFKVDIPLELVEEVVDKIDLASLEPFAVMVTGVKSRVVLRLNLHGPLYSPHYEGSRLPPLPLEE